jgi:dipeptidyl aminopeptidase/acylaminoacyl peptidase
MGATMMHWARSKALGGLLAVVLVASSASVLMTGGSAGATTNPGSNGLVAFVTSRSGKSQIWTVDPTTNAEQSLSDGTAADTDPAWSPFGTRLAFTRAGDVYVMNADGSHLVDLTANDPLSDGKPSWSPDGKHIVFSSDRDSAGRTQIYVMKANGSSVVRLTDDGAADDTPSWSPDGTHIAYVSNHNGEHDIYRMRANGSDQTDITSSGYSDTNPSWSPDGSLIVFTSTRPHVGSVGADLWIMHANGSDPTAFIHENNGYSDGDGAAFSPDGTQIVFSASNGSGSQQLWVAPAAGGQNTRITNDSGQPYDVQADWQRVVPAPSVSLDPASGPPSTQVTVSGGGFAPYEKVRLTFHDADKVNTSLGAIATGADGTFSGSVVIPADAAIGRGSFSFLGATSALTAHHRFTVTTPATSLARSG